MDGLRLELMTVDELRHELCRGACDSEEPFAYLAEVALALHARAGEAEMLELFEQLEDTEAARAVVFALAEQDASAIPVRALLHRLVDDAREFIAAEALDGLALGRTPLEPVAIERLWHHPSPYVRGAVLRYLARMTGRSAIPTLRTGLEDTSPIVRQNAIDELEELEARDAVHALRRMLTDSHPDVRAAARHALQTLGGE